MSLFKIKPVDRILSESEDKGHGLKRTLTGLQLVLLGIGAKIGRAHV